MTRKIGIIGCGHIAHKMAATLRDMEGYECHAVASRQLAKAGEFAAQYNIAKAYGSYEELTADKEVELIYIATPHALHYRHARLCVEVGKPVLVEKSFTANAAEAEALLTLAKEKQVFVAEAIWTRYIPLSLRVIDLVNNGAIGTPHTLTANLCYDIDFKERLLDPGLAGGTLLDLGVYLLNFAAMALGNRVERTMGVCTKTDSGVDAQESITQFFADNRIAVLTASMYATSDRMGVVSGEKGYIVVDNINNPQLVQVFNNDYRLVNEYRSESTNTGFEFQVMACFEALDRGEIETPYMPHSEIIRIMRLMDDLRSDWGVVFPNDSFIR